MPFDYKTNTKKQLLVEKCNKNLKFVVLMFMLHCAFQMTKGAHL